MSYSERNIFTKYWHNGNGVCGDKTDDFHDVNVSYSYQVSSEEEWISKWNVDWRLNDDDDGGDDDGDAAGGGDDGEDDDGGGDYDDDDGAGGGDDGEDDDDTYIYILFINLPLRGCSRLIYRLL